MVIRKELLIASPQVVVHSAALHYIPACLLAPYINDGISLTLNSYAKKLY